MSFHSPECVLKYSLDKIDVAKNKKETSGGSRREKGHLSLRFPEFCCLSISTPFKLFFMTTQFLRKILGAQSEMNFFSNFIVKD